MKLPKIANIKNIKHRSKNTFISEGIENWTVWIIACKFLALPANLTTLRTLNTLKTLPIEGAAERPPSAVDPIMSIKMSTIDDTTTKKSN